MTKFNKNEFKRAFKSIRKDTFLSLSNMFIMIVTFFILGVFIYIIAITQTTIRNLEQQAQLTIFFKDEFSEEGILSIQSDYIKDERIESINYVSKQQAYEIFTEVNKDEPILYESIDANILPASLEIRTKNINDLNQINDEFISLDGVEDIRYFKDIIDNFKFYSSIVYTSGFVIMLVFVFISYSIILYTLKSTISHKGMELSILKLVGATDSYVKNPFLYQGIIFGLISSSISGLFLILVSSLLFFSGTFVQGIKLGFLYGIVINPIVFSFIIFFILLFFGILLGYFGSYFAIKKYLKY